MDKKTTETRGGARANSGRKPVADKKIPVTIFIPASKVVKYGGAELLKQKLTNYVK